MSSSNKEYFSVTVDITYGSCGYELLFETEKEVRERRVFGIKTAQ